MFFCLASKRANFQAERGMQLATIGYKAIKANQKEISHQVVTVELLHQCFSESCGRVTLRLSTLEFEATSTLIWPT